MRRQAEPEAGLHRRAARQQEPGRRRGGRADQRALPGFQPPAVEPESLDQFIGALRSVAERAKAGDVALKSAPHFAPRSRLDETLAARKPVLVWKDLEVALAAE